MIGDYGAISPADPVALLTLMLVSWAAMRVHPVGGRVMQLLTSVCSSAGVNSCRST